MSASNNYSSHEAWKVLVFNAEFTQGRQNWRNRKKQLLIWCAVQALIQDGYWANLVLVVVVICRYMQNMQNLISYTDWMRVNVGFYFNVNC